MKKTLFLLPMMLLALVGCKKEQATAEAEAEAPVKTSLLAEQDIERAIEVSTNLEGWESVSISPSVTGKIEHIYVEVGTRVHVGQDLVRMDQMQYKTTKLAYINLGVDMKRMEALQETGSVAKQTYDQTKLSYDQTKENLDFLEQNTFVKSPCNGVVTAKNNEDGELYGGQPILVIQKVDQLKCMMAIPEQYLPRVKEGMAVNITSDVYPGETFPAKIVTIYPTIDPSSHCFQVKLCVPNAGGKLHPGSYVTSRLSLGSDRAIVVPYQAVQKLIGANTRYIFVNENGVAKRLDVTLGQRFDEQVEILGAGIKAGVEYISTGMGKCVDGTKIKVEK